VKLQKIMSVAVSFTACALLSGSLSAQPAEVRIVVTPVPGSYMSTESDLGLDATTRQGSTLRFVCQARSEVIMANSSLAWIFYSPDNSITTEARIENASLLGQWASVETWNGGPQLNDSDLINGDLPDYIIAGGVTIGHGPQGIAVAVRPK